MKSMLQDDTREELLTRLRSLRPDAPPRWGRMTAPRMLAHLLDQMRHTLGEAPTAPRPGVLRLPFVRFLALYCIPWPKGRVQGPPEAFLTPPGAWEADLATVETLLGRFVDQKDRTDWPDHALFGPMTRRDWGRLCYKHFDHHLRQFGA